MSTCLSIVLAVALGAGSGRAQPVEHWRAEGGHYALTFYPGFASRAYIEERSGAIVELYRQEGAFQLPDGERVAAAKHQLRLNGASLDESVAVSIRDPQHDVAEIRIALYSGSTLVIENDAKTCPPHCDGTEVKSARAPRMLAEAGRFDAPQTAVRTRGYDVSFYGGFASRVTSSVAGELFQQSKPYQLGDSPLAGRHQVRIAGGPSQRDLTLGVADGGHQIAHIAIELHGEAGETLQLKNDAKTCPPHCQQ